MSGSFFERRRGSLLLLLAGAGTLWIGHFAVVYLVAEWQCRPGRPGAPLSVLGVELTTLIVVAATIVAGLAIVALTRATLGGDDRQGGRTANDPHPGELAMMAWLLAGIFVFGAAIVGVTPLFLGPCA